MLDSQSIQREFCAAIREPQRFSTPSAISESRFQIYQQLIYNNFQTILSRAFPVLKKMTDWDNMVRNFIAVHPCDTPLFHKIPEMFLHYLSYRRNHPDDPPWLYELAHYEWVELALDTSPLELDATPHYVHGALMDEVIVLSPLAWPLFYEYPVHCIHPDKANIKQSPTYLLVYRNWEDRIQFMAINELTYDLLMLFRTKQVSGSRALAELNPYTGREESAIFMQSGNVLLDQLHQQHVILGTLPRSR